jgi:hypothetical protein
MNEPQRPDLQRLRRHLAVLIGVIAVSVAGFLLLTFYLYERFTRGITIAP